jgi:hypothetical protein
LRELEHIFPFRAGRGVGLGVFLCRIQWDAGEQHQNDQFCHAYVILFSKCWILDIPLHALFHPIAGQCPD